MMKKPLISAIIINWNSEQQLKNCIDSVINQNLSSIELIVVDNASTDNSVYIVQKSFPQVKIVSSEVNIGYSGGANLGIKSTSGKYVALLNPDIILEEKYFKLLADEFEKDNRLGFATGKLHRTEATECDSSQRLIDSTGHIIYKNRRVTDRGQEQYDHRQYEQAAEVFSVCGAAPVYRREMLDDISINGEIFDEDFFAYKEDVDLCWRANIFGWQGKYVPEAVALHDRGWKPGQRAKIPLFVRYHSLKNRYLMMVKNDFLINILKDLFYILIYDLLMFFYILVREPKALKAYLRVIQLFPKMLKKRKYIMAKCVVKSADIHCWFN